MDGSLRIRLILTLILTLTLTLIGGKQVGWTEAKHKTTSKKEQAEKQANTMATRMQCDRLTVSGEVIEKVSVRASGRAQARRWQYCRPMPVDHDAIL